MKPAARKALVSALFGSANEALPEAHQGAIDHFVETGVGLLPVTRGGDTTFYGFADDAAAARDLREILTAFVGPSYSTWGGPSAVLDDDDPVEGALLTAARGPVIRLESGQGQHEALRQAITLTLGVLQRRPTLKPAGVRPQHRVLSEFELALAAGNAARGEELLAELDRSGILSGINVLFLRLRWLHETGSPTDVLALDALPDMLRRRRPALVTIAIGAAVQATHVDRHHAAFLAGDIGAPRAARAAFDDLDAAYGDVLGNQLLTSSTHTRAVHTLHLAASDQIDVAQDLVARVSDEDERQWLEALIGLHDATPTPRDVGATAATPDPDTLVLRGRFAEAVDVLMAQDALSVSNAATLLRAAYSLDDADVGRRVVARVQELETDVLNALRRDRMLAEIEQRLVDEVSGQADREQGVGAWAEWFERLADEVDWPASLRTAEEGRLAWSRSELATADGIARLADAIERCGNDARTHASALGGLSHLLTWIDEDQHPEADLRPIQQRALELVTYAADPSEARDDLVVRLLDRLLTAGVTAEVLVAYLQDLADQWDEVASPRRLDWPIAVADVVLQTTGTTPALGEYFAHVVSSTARWADRLDGAQRLALASIGSELDVEVGSLAPIDDEPGGPAFGGLEGLSGLSVGLYTLTKGVGQRVAAVVRGVEGVEFEVNDDHVSTERLRALARRADVMVVVKRSAKHAATDAIFAVREQRDTPVAVGKGSAAVLRALQEWVADRTPAGA